MSPRKGVDESAKLTDTVKVAGLKSEFEEQKKVITSADVQFSTQNQVKSKKKTLHHESYVYLAPAALLDTPLNT